MLRCLVKARNRCYKRLWSSSESWVRSRSSATTARSRSAARSSARSSALLLVHAGAVVATDRLVTDLWGEEPPRTATTSLQNFVSQLRKLLGAGAIADEAARLRPPRRSRLLRPRPLRTPRRGRARPAPAERAELLRKALGALARPAARRPRLRDVRAGRDPPPRGAAARRARGPHRRRSRARAARRARRRARVARRPVPVSGAAAGQLMLALYRAGRQADALQAYHQARRRSSTSSGSSPGRRSGRSTRRSCARSAR